MSARRPCSHCLGVGGFKKYIQHSSGVYYCTCKIVIKKGVWIGFSAALHTTCMYTVEPQTDRGHRNKSDSQHTYAMYVSYPVPGQNRNRHSIYVPAVALPSTVTKSRTTSRSILASKVINTSRMESDSSTVYVSFWN